MILTFACVFRTGGEYALHHAFCLYRQVKANTTIPFRFVCLTDWNTKEVDEIELQQLKFNYPGWWSCIELWNLKGPTIVVGLDTLVTGNIDKLFELCLSLKENDFFLLSSPFNDKTQFINGIQIWNGDWSELVDEFDIDEDSKRFRGDENYLLFKLKEYEANIKPIQKHFPGIYNYGRQYKVNNPRDHKIIYFHGKEKPWKDSKLWKKYGKQY